MQINELMAARQLIEFKLAPYYRTIKQGIRMLTETELYLMERLERELDMVKNLLNKKYREMVDDGIT